MDTARHSPDTLLLITSTCPNCPAVLETFAQLVKQGIVGRLEVINLQQRPEAAEQYGVRSVPWFRIGSLEFQGSYSPAELRKWASEADSAEGLAAYLRETLSSGQLANATAAVKSHPAFATATAKLLGEVDTPMEVRIGLGAIYETLSGEKRLAELVPALAPLLDADTASIRNDACYLLGLTRSDAARPLLDKCLHDADEEVRETAREALQLRTVPDQS